MDPIADMFKKTDQTAEMPPVSLTMADVSVRLSALEDTVAQLKKLITQPAAAPTKPLEYSDIFPAKKGGRRTMKRRGKKNRRAN